MAVYFVRRRGDERGLIKIGFTRNFEHRLRSLSISVPEGLEVLAFCPSGGKGLERHLHEMFRDENSSGEWFRPSETLQSLVASVARFGDDAFDPSLLDYGHDGSDEPADRPGSGLGRSLEMLAYMISSYVAEGASQDEAIAAVAASCGATPYGIKHTISGRAKQIEVERYFALEAAYLGLLRDQKAEIDRRIAVVATGVEAEQHVPGLFDEIGALAAKVAAAKQRIM